MNRLNILLITDDQHRWDFFEGGVAPTLRTPALSRLAAEGTTLSHAFSNCPICMPTRFTWLYGLYASQARERLLANAHDWPTHFPSLAHALQQRGYDTSLIGKLHSHAGLFRRDLVADVHETQERGFNAALEVSGKSLAWWYDCLYTRHLARKGLLETYREDVASRCEQLGGRERYAPSPLPCEDHMDSFIGARAREALGRLPDDRPFFMHVSFCGPHFPLDPPEPYFSRYRPEDMPPPEGVEDGEEMRRWQERRALYCGLIELVDHEIGRLLQRLDEKSLANNTLVIFTTDHGDMMGHRGFGGKGRPFDTATRTPAIVRLPGVIAGGKTLDGLVEAADLPCTILEAAGCGDDDAIGALLPNTPGRSWWEYARGETDTHRQWVFSECNTGAWRMCRDRDWKYVFTTDGEDLLFDLRSDPWEFHNLIDDPALAERVSRMRAMLLESMSRCAAPNVDGGAGMQRIDG